MTADFQYVYRPHLAYRLVNNLYVSLELELSVVSLFPFVHTLSSMISDYSSNQDINNLINNHVYNNVNTSIYRNLSKSQSLSTGFRKYMISTIDNDYNTDNSSANLISETYDFILNENFSVQQLTPNIWPDEIINSTVYQSLCLPPSMRSIQLSYTRYFYSLMPTSSLRSLSWCLGFGTVVLAYHCDKSKDQVDYKPTVNHSYTHSENNLNNKDFESNDIYQSVLIECNEAQAAVLLAFSDRSTTTVEMTRLSRITGLTEDLLNSIIFSLSNTNFPLFKYDCDEEPRITLSNVFLSNINDFVGALPDRSFIASHDDIHNADIVTLKCPNVSRYAGKIYDEWKIEKIDAAIIRILKRFANQSTLSGLINNQISLAANFYTDVSLSPNLMLEKLVQLVYDEVNGKKF